MKELDVSGLLPPRREWNRYRAGVRARVGKDPAVVRRWAILRAVNRLRRDGTLADFRWGQKLLAFVEEVRRRVASENLAFVPPRLIPIEKGRKNGQPEYRHVASFDSVSDRVILSRLTAYVRDRLEGVLSPCCYSFRRDGRITYQTALEDLKRYRAKFPVGSLFVGECDIQKFFDNISHEVVRARWEASGLFDPAARNVLDAYLKAYAASEEGGRRGIPQGGSLSTVLANLVLAVADAAVEKVNDGQLFYARFCDDVVFVHPKEEVYRRAMTAYENALKVLDLPMHPVCSFVYRPLDGTPTSFYELKSKGPFRWFAAAPGEERRAPWLSFLGSQIRFDGETRIRKESIERHIRALRRVTTKAVSDIEKGEVRVANPGEAVKWFCRFRNRLIAKGVGHVKARERGICWAGAFPAMTFCDDAKRQMRRLDRVREGMLTKVWQTLLDKCLAANPSPVLPPEKMRPFLLKCRWYEGRPYSYFGFLKQATRPCGVRSGTGRRKPTVTWTEYRAALLDAFEKSGILDYLGQGTDVELNERLRERIEGFLGRLVAEGSNGANANEKMTLKSAAQRTLSQVTARLGDMSHRIVDLKGQLAESGPQAKADLEAKISNLMDATNYLAAELRGLARGLRESADRIVVNTKDPAAAQAYVDGVNKTIEAAEKAYFDACAAQASVRGGQAATQAPFGRVVYAESAMSDAEADDEEDDIWADEEEQPPEEDDPGDGSVY